MPHDSFPVYDVSHPTGEESQGVRNAIELPHLPALVAQEGERQGVLCGETTVRTYRIRAYPDDLGVEPPEFLVIVPKDASLLGAARSIVFGVEEKDHGLLSYEVLEADHLSRLRGEREARSYGPHFHLAFRSLKAHLSPGCRALARLN